MKSKPRCYYHDTEPCTCPQPARTESAAVWCDYCLRRYRVVGSEYCSECCERQKAYEARLMARPKMSDLSLLNEPWPDPEPPTDEAERAITCPQCRAPDRASKPETCPTCGNLRYAGPYCSDSFHLSDEGRASSLAATLEAWNGPTPTTVTHSALREGQEGKVPASLPHHLDIPCHKCGATESPSIPVVSGLRRHDNERWWCSTDCYFADPTRNQRNPGVGGVSKGRVPLRDRSPGHGTHVRRRQG